MNTTTDELTERELTELLAAGALFPRDMHVPGAVPVQVRTYRHPALGDRTIVRLVNTNLVTAEDALAGLTGLKPHGEPDDVGFGPVQSIGFPGWVLVRYPDEGHHALAVVARMGDAAELATKKPKKALDSFEDIASQLSVSVPHFLPSYYEQVARIFLDAGSTTYAGRMFAKARRAEAEFGLTIDEEQLDSVIEEFSIAGVVSTTQLRDYSRGLKERVPGPGALHRFRRVCLRRVATGTVPDKAMVTELRSLAKLAAEDPHRVEVAFLADILGMSGATKAAASWWTTCRKAYATLAGKDPSVRGQLLNTMPDGHDLATADAWLALLEATEATQGLIDADRPTDQQPRDGAAGWLTRFHQHVRSNGEQEPLPALYSLVERMADRLRTETGDAPLAVTNDAALIDTLLAEHVPVVDPADDDKLYLEAWAEIDDPPRDLNAIAADPRFAAPFQRKMDHFNSRPWATAPYEKIVRCPGGKAMLTDWVRTVAARTRVTTLTALPDELKRLVQLPDFLRRLASDEVHAALQIDVTELLARALNVGIHDEMSWPAWDEAIASFPSERDAKVLEAWPHLIVASRERACVIGPEGVTLTHEVNPDFSPHLKRKSDEVGFRYVDGSLLVFGPCNTWRETTGYWHTDPARIEKIEGDHGHPGWEPANYYAEGLIDCTIPLPSGGRATGCGVLRVGDFELPGEGAVAGDGVSLWARERWSYRSTDWHDWDPASGDVGERGALPVPPSVLDQAPAGTTAETQWMRPIAADGSASAGVVGLVKGTTPAGEQFMADFAGNSISLPADDRSPLLFWPVPHAAPLVWVSRAYTRWDLLDSTGARRGNPDCRWGAFAEEKRTPPPAAYWHYLTPVDPQGSQALRDVDRDTAERLLAVLAAAGAAEDPANVDVAGQMGAVVPDVTDRTLLSGVIGIARFAAERRRDIDESLNSLNPSTTPDSAPAKTARMATGGPDDDTEQGHSSGDDEPDAGITVPDHLLAAAQKDMPARKDETFTAADALRAATDPQAEQRLTTDVAWELVSRLWYNDFRERDDTVAELKPVSEDVPSFDADTLLRSVSAVGWLNHHLPAGDRLRDQLGALIDLLRQRLDAPRLALSLRVGEMWEFKFSPYGRDAGGSPQKEKGYTQYGPYVFTKQSYQTVPMVRPAAFETDGPDPYEQLFRFAGHGPTPVIAAIRDVRGERLTKLAADPGDPAAGSRDADGTWWPQDPSRSVPDLATDVAQRLGVGPDAATYYLMLLAMPDPTDRNVRLWTGWKTPRIKAAGDELADASHVLRASRPRAGRKFFLPGGWEIRKAPQLPLEQWKLSLFEPWRTDPAPHVTIERYTDDYEREKPTMEAIVPLQPAADLYRQAWQRVLDGDEPRFEEFELHTEGGSPGGRR